MADQPLPPLPPLGSTPPSATPAPPPPPGVTAPTPDPERSGPRRSLVVALAAVVAVAGLVGALLVLTGGDDGSGGAFAARDTPEDVQAAAEAIEEWMSNSTAVPAPTTTAPAAPPPTVSPTTTAAPTTTAPSTTAPPTTVPGPSYPTLPDGSPEPIIAIFDGPVVRVSGWVPSQEKADQLTALALANSTDPAAKVEANLQIDPAVPLGIGTRVIEMNSPRFAPGSSEVTPEHAAQLDRVAGVLGLLPNVTVTVVGHADQIGNEVQNYVLSEQRAVSVVRYLVGAGIAPSRLAARAVGDQDLLTEEQSPDALALNRRTEFIFFGLLAD
ncbi:MAG TPA: OmpA family protein [Ilumatobacteraceae bacterium]|nr:OmpA family protein [Ilumatobacteraceae bacterium]